ncbi:MAG TPA: phage portal protein [Nocardioidaceae bacterium]|nr:phage portal protein [Nocardioidaceae bacterium]
MTVQPIRALGEPVGSPLWWVRRLHQIILNRLTDIEMYDNYYAGRHPAPWLAPQAQTEFRRLLRMTRSNYMGLVVDATVERQRVQGFRLGDDPAPDRELWRIWQANDFDVEHVQGIRDSTKRGRSFLLVGPNPVDPATPLMWIEDARESAVDYVPGTNRRVRAAGLKLWVDDWTAMLNATLYLPDWVYKFHARGKGGAPSSSTFWQPREVARESWPAPNPLGVVPLIEMPNIDRCGVSEIDDVIPIQDRINKTLADRMMSQDFGAFPQKWAIGYPTEDESGNKNTPIDVGRDRMVTSDVAETKFGQWDAAPLDPFSAAKSEDVNDIAARTRTPPQYLLGRMVNIPGNAMEAAESGLVAKVTDRRMLPERSFEEGMRLVRVAAGNALPSDVQIETDWVDPQFRTEAEKADAAVKKYGAGITTLRQVREDLGYTPAQIARMEAEDEKAAGDPLTAELLRGLPGRETGGGGS